MSNDLLRAHIAVGAVLERIAPAPHFSRPVFSHDVAVVGLGYVGLPTALAFHAAGQDVMGLDISANRLADVRSGRVDLLDSDRRRLETCLTDGRFHLRNESSQLGLAATVLICVPTPVDGHLVPDLAMLEAACADVVAHAQPGQVIILTSTTYVGSTRDFLIKPLALRGLIAGRDVHVAFSPERIDPGNRAHALETVPRVVGGATPLCTIRAIESLGCYTKYLHPVSSTDTAEMTKLVENTFRAVNVALANEFADISRELKLDVMEVISAAATKPYGFMAFKPGPGVGGHCIPCDPHYLLWQLRERRIVAPVIEQAMHQIAGRPLQVIERIRSGLSEGGLSLRGSRVLLVGVAYKADVEDVRESPALLIIASLLDAGVAVSYFDPLVPVVRLPRHQEMRSVADPLEVDADLVVVHTAHSGLSLGWLQNQKTVIDATYTLHDLPQQVTL
jgi:UDP-N-acetyl-D-glucosamine dehydrogenase